LDLSLEVKTLTQVFHKVSLFMFSKQGIVRGTRWHHSQHLWNCYGHADYLEIIYRELWRISWFKDRW